ncbi:aspartate--tRNA ligase [Candidatus Peregrinibacteria bacterium]|nr:MAG: aspartate--tRNA ligase [Candidatus Peregrinibacteria bacterium]
MPTTQTIYRTHRIQEISEHTQGLSITISGWVSSIRDHGELIFIDLRESEILQIRLNRDHLADFDQLAKIKPESTIQVSGIIIKRESDDYNSSLRTGTIELDATEIIILNMSKTLPFEIKKAHKTKESLRMKYKFLEMRSDSVQKTLLHRHKIIKSIRDSLDDQDFIEVETPVLTAGSEEGSREFIIPSRQHPGEFYTLPQAPQQFKQMLMTGGIEKYFQIAKCFRDEDSRGDRQPEFTQLDMELAFVSMQDIIDLNTKLFQKIIPAVYTSKWKIKPFQTITYKTAMDKYGTDKPDIRFDLFLEDITDIVRKTEFEVFKKPIQDGGIVKCIKVSHNLQTKKISKGQIEKLTLLAQSHGLGGLAYIIVKEDELQSPIIKYLGESVSQEIIKFTQAQPGDIVFFSAAHPKIANAALDAVRRKLADMLDLIPKKELHPLWVIDFPQFERTDDGSWTFSHNPFSLPKPEYLKQHMKITDTAEILAQQYDLVLNGHEIAGGSIRSHSPDVLTATYKHMGYSDEQIQKSIGHMLEAFSYGAPPHGGIAWGIDRLMMILEEKESIRDVIAFPKTGSGQDILFQSPSPLSEQKLHEANIRTTFLQK